MKKLTTKLALNKEVIRSLTDRGLREAAGGAIDLSIETCHCKVTVNTCDTACGHPLPTSAC